MMKLMKKYQQKKTCKSKKTIATKRMMKKFDRKKIQRGWNLKKKKTNFKNDSKENK